MKSQSDIEMDQYKAWIAAQANKYVVTCPSLPHSPPMNSENECKKWILEHLPEGARYYINKL